MCWVVSDFATIYVRIYVCGLTAEHCTEFRGRAALCCVQAILQKLFYFDRVILCLMLIKIVPFVLFREFVVSNSMH